MNLLRLDFQTSKSISIYLKWNIKAKFLRQNFILVNNHNVVIISINNFPDSFESIATSTPSVGIWDYHWLANSILPPELGTMQTPRFIAPLPTLRSSWNTFIGTLSYLLFNVTLSEFNPAWFVIYLRNVRDAHSFISRFPLAFPCCPLPWSLESDKDLFSYRFIRDSFSSSDCS